MHGDLGLNPLEVLEKTGTKVNAGAVKEVFLERQQIDCMAPVMDFVWWLIRAGLARPQGFNGNTLFAFDMTPAGLRFLDSGEDHPLTPGFPSRLRERHPDIPEGIIVLVEDAQACLDFGLLRPATVLLGLAYETAVEKILMELAGKALVDPQKVRRADAGERLGTLKRQLSGLKFQQDERRLAEAAVDFADHLRERRNDAAHTTPRWPFESLDEIEDLLLSAGRYLPRLWAIANAEPAERPSM